MKTTRKGRAGDIRHSELCLVTETVTFHSGIGWEHETPRCFYSPHPQKLRAFLSFSSSFLLCLFTEISTALTGDRRRNTPIDINSRYKYQCRGKFADQGQLCWAEIKRGLLGMFCLGRPDFQVRVSGQGAGTGSSSPLLNRTLSYFRAASAYCTRGTFS